MRLVAFNRGHSSTLGAFAAALAFPAAASPAPPASPAVGYDGLDRIGRVAELGYFAGPPGGPGPGSTDLHSYSYGYDLADQPIWKEVTQRDYAAQTHANTRSWLYGYGAPHRLADPTWLCLGAAPVLIPARPVGGHGHPPHASADARGCIDRRTASVPIGR